METLSLSSIAYLLNLHASSQHLTLSSVAFEQGVHLTTTRVALSDRASTSTAASADGDGLRAGPLLAANLHPTAALTLSTRHAQHMEWPFWESDVAAVCVSNAGLLFADPTAQRSTATIRFSHPLRGKLLFAAFLSTVRGGAGLSSKLCVSKLYVSSASRFVEHNRSFSLSSSSSSSIATRTPLTRHCYVVCAGISVCMRVDWRVLLAESARSGLRDGPVQIDRDAKQSSVRPTGREIDELFR